MRINRLARSLIRIVAIQIASASLLNAASLEERIAAFNKALEQADGGDPIACYAVGSMYETGVNGPRDYNRALQYYERSSELGYPFALLKLGEFSNKVGSKSEIQNLEERATIEVADLLSNPHKLNAAELNLIADLHFKGTGTFEKSDTRAVVWWKKAADLGDEAAIYQLAITNLSISPDEKVRKDSLEALCKLAKEAHPLAIALLHSVLYGNPPNLRPQWKFTQAEQVLIDEAVEAGLDELTTPDYLNDFFKTFYVADFLWSGIGFDKDESNAIATWKRSLDLGNFKAADLLIALYLGRMGGGRYKNLDDAKRYLELRAKYGDSCSAEILRSLESGIETTPEIFRPIQETLRQTFSGRN